MKIQFEGYFYHRNRSQGDTQKTASACVFPFLAVMVVVMNGHDGCQTDSPPLTVLMKTIDVLCPVSTLNAAHTGKYMGL